MKKIIRVILLLVACLLATALYMHYKGYDRRIARKIIHIINRESKPVGGTLNLNYYLRTLGDLNNAHLRSARKLGLKQPLRNRQEAETVKGNLVRIQSNRHYKVDRLTHSVPYLTNGTAELLGMIGKNFNDSLKSKNLPQYRIIVTSVLRTEDDIKRLKDSGNVNATANSAHCYATTFDITYARYEKVDRFGKSASTGTLQKVLGEVMLDLKKQKKCYVKFEVKQRCFHITTRI